MSLLFSSVYFPIIRVLSKSVIENIKDQKKYTLRVSES